MSINSNQKGKDGERELARLLTASGYECRRGQQYEGSSDSPDVVGLPGIHIECKRVERLNLDNAMSQAISECGAENKPAVFHRKNHQPWKVTMFFDDWIELYREWEAGR